MHINSGPVNCVHLIDPQSYHNYTCDELAKKFQNKEGSQIQNTHYLLLMRYITAWDFSWI